MGAKFVTSELDIQKKSSKIMIIQLFKAQSESNSRYKTFADRFSAITSQTDGNVDSHETLMGSEMVKEDVWVQGSKCILHDACHQPI